MITIPCSFKYYFTVFFPPAITPRLQRLSMSVSVMHELGHTLGLMPTTFGGIDNYSQFGRNDLPFLEKEKIKKEAKEYWSNYISCMNYDKFFQYVIDYSDGSHGGRDFNDWGFFDLTYFQKASSEDYDIFY